MILVHALWALQLLVSAALLAKMLAIFEEEKEILGIKQKSLCESWDDLDKDYQCSELKGGVVS